MPVQEQTIDVYALGYDRNLNKVSAQSLNEGGSAFLPNSVSGPIRVESLVSGEMSSILFHKKVSFTDTTAGYRMGLDSDGTYKWVIGDSSGSIDWNVTTANTLTITGAGLVSPIIRYGKTSFSDNVNAGYYISTEGIYIGAANDTTVMKYTVATGAYDFIGTVSSRSTLTIANAINTNGNLITDIINARLDSSAKRILSDFDFGSTNYAGAVKAGDLTWNTTTGAITGGSGVVVYRGGIVGAAAGVATFTIDISGNATFAGTLSAAIGTLGALTIAVGGNIKSGKTSFTDGTNAGWYVGTEGIYVGAAADASVMKYTISSGIFDFIGTVSSRSTATIASAINVSGNVITDLINARLDSSAKTILSDFNFGAVNYAGAVKAGDITWNTTTGAITGGSGVVVYRGGIVGASAGVATFTIDTAGNATFAGTLSAATGTFAGSLTAATGTLGALTIASGGNIKLGQTAYNTGTGFWFGDDGGTTKFSIGNSGGNRVTWDGSTFSVIGTIASGSTIGGTAATTVESNSNNAWTQIGETVLGGAATSISVTGLAARTDLRIIVHIYSSSGNVSAALRFNNDSAGNYYEAQSLNGAASTTFNGASEIQLTSTSAITLLGLFAEVAVVNISSKEKLYTSQTSEFPSGGTLPNALEGVGYWNNTSAQITRVDILSLSAATFATGSRITVYAKKD